MEIWVREDPEETEQTPYVNGVGAAYLVPEADGSKIYTFDKVRFSIENNSEIGEIKKLR